MSQCKTNKDWICGKEAYTCPDCKLEVHNPNLFGNHSCPRCGFTPTHIHFDYPLHWKENKLHAYTCILCNHIVAKKIRYCPNCGSKKVIR